MNPQTERPLVLIVDDEPTNIQVLAAALCDRYELHFATDAKRALQLATTASFDLILLDVVMPGRDGFDVLAALRADPRQQHVPVIFVTSMSESDDEARGLTLGAVDYIAKPANPAIVRARVATHIELKRQRDLLERHAFIDGLTGIANRRRFDQQWPLYCQRLTTEQRPLSVLLIDIDRFKAYNDHYGHLAGDDCLRRVAAALNEACGQGLCARYGGEEFVVLDDVRSASLLASDLLAAVAALKLPHAKSTDLERVSISIGGRTLAADADGLPPQWLKSTDELLFRAKSEGRNRAIVCDLRDDVRILLPGDIWP